jgi:hypothetical protein
VSARRISEKRAVEQAVASGLLVSVVVPIASMPGIDRGMTVGRAELLRHGNRGCWCVRLDGVEHAGGYIGEAIAIATSLQSARGAS